MVLHRRICYEKSMRTVINNINKIPRSPLVVFFFKLPFDTNIQYDLFITFFLKIIFFQPILYYIVIIQYNKVRNFCDS